MRHFPPRLIFGKREGKKKSRSWTAKSRTPVQRPRYVLVRLWRTETEATCYEQFVIIGHLTLAASLSAQHCHFEYAHRYKLAHYANVRHLFCPISSDISFGKYTTRGAPTYAHDLAGKGVHPFSIALMSPTLPYGTLNALDADSCTSIPAAASQSWC
ncbi:hypothetical protein M426DRAFT_145014 [Hypoxylon sp. CI-4A]|nr:hypothetical protein M426DRAFT_145014 [Hypoxylon sp. CI-4A]